MGMFDWFHLDDDAARRCACPAGHPAHRCHQTSLAGELRHFIVLRGRLFEHDQFEPWDEPRRTALAHFVRADVRVDIVSGCVDGTCHERVEHTLIFVQGLLSGAPEGGWVPGDAWTAVERAPGMVADDGDLCESDSAARLDVLVLTGGDIRLELRESWTLDLEGAHARFEERLWEPEPGAVGGRRARKSFRYRAYVPGPIARWDGALGADAATAIEAAGAALARLESHPALAGERERATVDAPAPGTLARWFAAEEARASSSIEGVVRSRRRVARSLAIPPDRRDPTTRAVIGSLAAVELALELAILDWPVTVRDLLGLHRVLAVPAGLPGIPGQPRTTQNWIGGSSSSPEEATFVPPPPEHVPALLEDLRTFASRRDLPPVLVAAAAHAQFETIHPFLDGNGRVGRALVRLVLARRGVSVRAPVPVSAVLLEGPYVERLSGWRDGAVDAWVTYFADALHRAAERAVHTAEMLAGVVGRWSEEARRAGAPPDALRLAALLPGLPAFTLTTAASALRCPDDEARAAIDALATCGALRSISLSQRMRGWEASFPEAEPP